MRVQTLKEQIVQQEEIMKEAGVAKEKALEECKRIEREMADFNNNKDSKLDEMNVTSYLNVIRAMMTHVICLETSGKVKVTA